MLTDQQVFDHCVDYFQDRFNQGYFTPGWGSGDDPKDRCALGSIFTGKCYTAEIPFIVKEMIGLRSNDSFSKFHRHLMQLNDRIAIGKLPIIEINRQLTFCALLHGLQFPNQLTQKPVSITAPESIIVIKETENV